MSIFLVFNYCFQKNIYQKNINAVPTALILNSVGFSTIECVPNGTLNHQT